jgi:hypothetical protein
MSHLVRILVSEETARELAELDWTFCHRAIVDVSMAAILALKCEQPKEPIFRISEVS